MIHLDEKDESNSSGQPIAAAESLEQTAVESATADETGDAEEPEFELDSAESEDEAEIQMEEKDFAGEAPELVYNWLSSNKDDASIWQHRRAYHSLRQRVHELMDEDRQVKLRAFMALDDAEESEFVYEPAEILKELRRLSKQFGDALNRIRKQTENDLNANLLAKKDVLDEMRQVITDESDIKKAIQKFRTLLKRWKEIGSIPSREADVVYNNYRHFNKMFFDFLRINEELSQMDIQKVQQIREELIQQAERLADEPSINQCLQRLLTLRKEWRESGYLPDDLDQSTFERFKAACDAVYNRRDAHYKEQDELRQANLTSKLNLLEQIKGLATENYTQLSDWKKAEEQFQTLDADWRKVGSVPRAQSNSIWAEFLEAKKQFFKHRNRIFKEQQSKYAEAVKVKTALIEEAEALKDSQKWKETTEKIKVLQQRWKASPPVDRKRSDALWNRFRAACDGFFESKKNWFEGQSGREQDNLKQKQAILAELQQCNLESEEEAQAALAELQKKWESIGFVPFKEKAGLESAWDEAVANLRQRLGIDPERQAKMAYKEKLEAMDDKKLTDERRFLGSKAKQIQDEIIQIENSLERFINVKGNESFLRPHKLRIERLRVELEGIDSRRQQLKVVIKQRGLN
ncbi:MAG: DUF349 domain-containing protein [Flavobacteriales bacterium]